jgi:hypothetical protein
MWPPRGCVLWGDNFTKKSPAPGWMGVANRLKSTKMSPLWGWDVLPNLISTLLFLFKTCLFKKYNIFGDI